MHPLERETLKSLVEASGGKIADVDTIVDERLSFKQNKRIVKEYLKGSGKVPDLRTELLKEKELGEQMAEAEAKRIETEEEIKYSKVKSREKEITDYIKDNMDDVMDEIESYNPHCKNITYATLFAGMNARTGKQRTNVINKGKQGIGKSRGSTELIEALDMTDAVVIKGYMTPKKLFNTLKHHRTSMIILDEGELIMSNPMALFILRSALYGGEVSWLSTRGDVLDMFKFEGTVIANINAFSITEAEAQPLFDRCLYNDNDLSNVQVMEKMKSVHTYKPNKKIWADIKDKITLIRTDGLRKLTPEETDKMMGHIEMVARSSGVFSKSLSTRAVHRTKLVYSCLKSLFSGLEGKPLKLAEELSKPYIVNDNIEDVCINILSQDATLNRKELTEVIAQTKGIGMRQASRIVKSALERNIIESPNRSTVRIKGKK